MEKKEYRVALVVDRAFGERLIELSKRMHVWICGSTENERVTAIIRASSPEYSFESGVTTFTITPSETPEEMCLDRISDVETHHGSSSHNPPWTALEVYGVPPSAEIEATLREYGANRVEKSGSGFIAFREVNEAV